MMAAEPAAIRDALVRQAWSPVRWIESVQALRAAGVGHVYEFGPGKVLAGLVKRIDGEMAVEAVTDAETFNKLLA